MKREYEKTGRLTVIGEIPTLSHGENQQFHRVLALIDQIVKVELGYGVAVLHHTYRQNRIYTGGSPDEWEGEFDIILFASDRIFIYELKSGALEINWGRTDRKPWHILRQNHYYTVKSWFTQTSRQRTFLLQTFLNQHKYLVNGPDHFMVDARIVCETGSNFAGFRYLIPSTIIEEDLRYLSETLPSDDFSFISGMYNLREKRTGHPMIHCGATSDEYLRIEQVFDTVGYQKKTSRWFKLITEAQLRDDLLSTHTERFHLSEQECLNLALALTA